MLDDGVERGHSATTAEYMRLQTKFAFALTKLLVVCNDIKTNGIKTYFSHERFVLDTRGPKSEDAQAKAIKLARDQRLPFLEIIRNGANTGGVTETAATEAIDALKKAQRYEETPGFSHFWKKVYDAHDNPKPQGQRFNKGK